MSHSTTLAFPSVAQAINPAALDPFVVLTRRREQSQAGPVEVEYLAVRRLYNVRDAATLLGESPGQLRTWVNLDALPSVALPSTVSDPSRTLRMIPAAWMERYLRMIDRSRPVWTARADIGDPRDMRYVGVSEAAQLVGITAQTVYALIKLGRFPQPEIAPNSQMRLRVARIDDFVHELVKTAEERWYGRQGAASKAVAR